MRNVQGARMEEAETENKQRPDSEGETFAKEARVESSQKTETLKPISLDEARNLAPTDSLELVRTIDIIAKGGGFPERFDTREKRIAAYSLARSLMGEEWQLALNHIAVIRGSMVIYGELPRAICERTKEVEEFKVYTIDSDYKVRCIANKNLSSEPWAGVCEVKRKGRATKEFSYSVEDAKTAGQLPAKPDSPWNKYRHVMLMRKAQALGVKFEFPDAILGAEISEHAFDIAPDLKDVGPVQNFDEVVDDKASKLNKKFNIPRGSVVAPLDGEKL